jgi:uncharacterized cupin superfamily protein
VSTHERAKRDRVGAAADADHDKAAFEIAASRDASGSHLICQQGTKEQCMPRLDIAAVPVRKGSGYPPPFDAPCAARTRQRLGDAAGLRDFGVNLMTLPPGSWSSQRHWHSEEDEFVYLIEGELMLIEDGAETVLHAGDCAAFPKGSGNGHHLINKSSAVAVYLEVGSRNRNDLTTCSDIDMMSSNADGRFVHKDGSPYPKS